MHEHICIYNCPMVKLHVQINGIHKECMKYDDLSWSSQ